MSFTHDLDFIILDIHFKNTAEFGAHYFLAIEERSAINKNGLPKITSFILFTTQNI